MRNSYVLDESVAHCAATGQNEKGEDDPSAFQLIEALYRGRYELIFSHELYTNWVRALNNEASSSEPLLPKTVFRYLRLFMSTQGSFSWAEDPPEFEGEEQVPPDDLYWIRMAIHYSSIAVTTDNRLMEILNDASIVARHSLTLLRPEDALSQLQLP